MRFTQRKRDKAYETSVQELVLEFARMGLSGFASGAYVLVLVVFELTCCITALRGHATRTSCGLPAQQGPVAVVGDLHKNKSLKGARAPQGWPAPVVHDHMMSSSNTWTGSPSNLPMQQLDTDCRLKSQIQLQRFDSTLDSTTRFKWKVWIHNSDPNPRSKCKDWMQVLHQNHRVTATSRSTCQIKIRGLQQRLDPIFWSKSQIWM